MTDVFEQLNQRYPFISVLEYGDNTYAGIIQNKDTLVTSFYDFGVLHNEDHKKLFLGLGEQWWWESNRMIPINIFLRKEWVEFKYSLRSFNTKDVRMLHGPAVSLLDFAARKTKRRSITLVRKTV